MSFGDYRPERNAQGIDYAIGDLRDWHCIEIACGGCRRRALLDVPSVKRRFGKYILSSQIAPKLRCGKCGNRMGNAMTLCKQRRD